MAKIPPLPPLRCQATQPDLPSWKCARPATYERRDPLSGSVTVICGACRTSDDTPLFRAVTIHTVKVTAEISFAGLSVDIARARSEVIETIERAVLSAGGQVSVTAVTSSQARYYPPLTGQGRPPAAGQG